MHGWFNSTLRGHEAVMMQLRAHLINLAHSDEMYARIVSLMGEMVTLEDGRVEVQIGMDEPDVFDWFCEDTYFNEIAQQFPDVELIGSVECDQPYLSTTYYCAPGSSELDVVEVLGTEPNKSAEGPDFFSQFGSMFEESFNSFEQMDSPEIDEAEFKQLEKEMEQFCNTFAQNILGSIFEMTGMEPEVKTNFFCWQFNSNDQPQPESTEKKDLSPDVIDQPK